MKILIIDEKGVREFIPSIPNSQDQSKSISGLEIYQKKSKEFKLKEKDNTPKVYSISKLIELFETTRPTIYSWIKKGLLKPIKLGGRVYFNHKDIEVLLIDKASDST